MRSSRTPAGVGSVRYVDVRIPQSDDKVVATLTVARYGIDGRELPPEDSVYLVTRQENRWGIQASSTRYAIGGLL
jgi:predicted secreted protein